MTENLSSDNASPSNSERIRAKKAAIAEISTIGKSGSSFDLLLERILTRLTECLFADASAVSIREEGHPTRTWSIAHGANDGLRALVALVSLEDGSAAGRSTVFQGEDLEALVTRTGLSKGVSDSGSLLTRTLKIGDVTLGTLAIARRASKQPFDAADLEFLEVVAPISAAAYRTAWRATGEERRATRLSALVRIGRKLSATLELEGVCRNVLEEISRLYDAGSFYVATYEDGAEYWTREYAYDRGLKLGKARHPLSQGITGFIIKERVPLLFGSCAELESFAAGIGMTILGGSAKSWMGVPLIAGDSLVGVMAIQSYESENLYSDTDLELFATVGTHVAIAIQNARLFERARHRAEETAALAEISREISSTLDLDLVLDRITESAKNHLDSGSAAIFLSDRESGELRAVAAKGSMAELLRTLTIKRGSGLIGRIFERETAELVNATAADPRAIPLPGLNGREDNVKIMVAPLIVEGEALGVMTTWRDCEGRDFEPDDLTFLQGLARQASAAIRNARMYSQVLEAKAEADLANKAKSGFLAHTSHELRTPLNAIINFSYLLLSEGEGTLSADQADLLARIEDSGRGLLTIINDLLDLAKIEAGKMVLATEKVEVAPLVRQVAFDVSYLLAGKDLRIADAIPDDLPAAWADRTRFRQILLNLLSNAAKFTERGTIDISAEEKDGRLEFGIADTGPGMTSEELERAFSEFEQIQSGSKDGARGTGLGLPICKRLVELHGGTMWAESVPGKGSTFRFTLPLGPRS